MPTTSPSAPHTSPAPTIRARLLSLGLALALAGAAHAEILALLSSDAAPYAAAAAGLRQALPDKTVRTIVLDKDTKGSLAALAAKAEAVMAIGGPAAALCRETLGPASHFSYCMVADPGASGLASDPRAEGVTTDVPLEAQAEVIAEALPDARQVAFLFNSTVPASRAGADRLTKALRPGWTAAGLDTSKFSSPAEAINRLLDSGADVVWTTPDPAVYSSEVIKALLLAALRHKTPVFGFSSQFVKAGALLGTGIDPASQGRLAAELLRNPGTGVHPPRFQLFVNTVVAEEIGVRLPESLLKRADTVYSGGEK